MDNLESLRDEMLAAVNAAASLADLDEVRVAALGKKGRVTGLMKELGGLDPDARRARGQALNVVKDELAAALDARRQSLEDAALEAQLAAESLDVT